MKDKKPLDWIPLFIDKHLFGSTRLELEPDERSVWTDLLVLSGKDDGYIRANEGVPYINSQLAGLLVIPEELLERTIKKCTSKEIKKIIFLKDGTMYLLSWEEYKLSPRHMRRFEVVAGKRDTMAGKADIHRKVEDTIERDIEKERDIVKKKEEYTPEFLSFYREYPKQKGKMAAFLAWKQHPKKNHKELIEAAVNYRTDCYQKRTYIDFVKDASGFIRKSKEYWKDYLTLIDKSDPDVMPDKMWSKCAAYLYCDGQSEREVGKFLIKTRTGYKKIKHKITEETAIINIIKWIKEKSKK